MILEDQIFGLLPTSSFRDPPYYKRNGFESGFGGFRLTVASPRSQYFEALRVYEAENGGARLNVETREKVRGIRR